MVAQIVHEQEPKPSFALPFADAIDALTVWSSFDGWILVEWRGAHDRDGRAAAGRVIAIAAVVGREHVRIAMKNAYATNMIGLNEVGDFAPLGGKDAPMVLVADSAAASTTAETITIGVAA